MTTERPDFSIVVPVFNGSSTLEELCMRTSVTMEKIGSTFEMILVDDGSRDLSWDTICKLKNIYGEQVKGFQLIHNHGQQAATICGLQQSKGRFVVTLDDDLQTPPEEIPKLLDAINANQADVAFGVYEVLHHHFIHRKGTRVFRYLLRAIAPAFPNGSSYRIIRSDILKRFPWTNAAHFSIDPILGWLTRNIITVPVNHERSAYKNSRYSTISLIGMALKILVLYSVWPLRLMIWTGFLAALISFGLGLYFLYQKLTVGAALGFSALMVTITFATGIILLSITCCSTEP